MSSLPNLARVRFQPPEDIPHSEKQLIILCMSLILCNLRIFIQILEYFSTSCQLKWMVPGKALRFPKSKGHCSTWGHGFTMDIIHQNLETKQNITKPPNKERIKTQCVPCFIIKNPHLPTKIENSLGTPHLGHSETVRHWHLPSWCCAVACVPRASDSGSKDRFDHLGWQDPNQVEFHCLYILVYTRTKHYMWYSILYDIWWHMCLCHLTICVCVWHHQW